MSHVLRPAKPYQPPQCKLTFLHCADTLSTPQLTRSTPHMSTSRSDRDSSLPLSHCLLLQQQPPTPLKGMAMSLSPNITSTRKLPSLASDVWLLQSALRLQSIVDHTSVGLVVTSTPIVRRKFSLGSLIYRSSAYLSIGRNKFWRKNHVKAHYAFNEQVAMVDFTYNENKSNDKPLAKV